MCSKLCTIVIVYKQYSTNTSSPNYNIPSSRKPDFRLQKCVSIIPSHKFIVNWSFLANNVTRPNIKTLSYYKESYVLIRVVTNAFSKSTKIQR